VPPAGQVTPGSPKPDFYSAGETPRSEWTAVAMNTLEPRNSRAQLIWGTALIIVGIAVFFRIPQVMPRLEQMGQSDITLGFIRICFYIMGVLLVGGGARKIIFCLRRQEPEPDAEDAGKDN